MNIICDTRERLPLNFEGHRVVRRKLDEGDYCTPELEPYLVIERKSLMDAYSSLLQGHRRFTDELMRARLKGKRVYVFVEGSKEALITHRFPGGWYRNSPKPAAFASMIETISEKYGVIWMFCADRHDMEFKIIETFKLWNKLRGVETK